jgi:hypothetical protein
MPWKRRPKRTEGSAKAVSAAKGTLSIAGTPPKDSPTEKLPARAVHRQIPELVLEHDRHLLRVACPQMAGHGDARMVGAEGEVEMMLTGQPVLATCAQRIRARRHGKASSVQRA